jgi:hypothetical protein
MRRIEARRRNARALRLRFSKSLANLRHRLNQAKCTLDDPPLRQDLEPFCMIRAFDDFDRDVGKRFGQGLLKDRPLVAAVGKELLQKRIHANRRRAPRPSADVAAVLDDLSGKTTAIPWPFCSTKLTAAASNAPRITAMVARRGTVLPPLN